MSKPRQKLPLIASIAMTFFGIVAIWTVFTGGEQTIPISQEQAQTLINKGLERKKADDPHMPFRSVQIIFGDNNTLMATAEVERAIEVPFLATHTARGIVQATGKPTYRNGKFYFVPTSPIELSNLSFRSNEKTPGPFAETLNSLKEKARGKAEEFIKKHGLQDTLTILKKEFEEWYQTKGQDMIEKTLSEHPIYVLKSTTKDIAIYSVLKSVKVENRILYVTLSIFQFAYSVLIGFVFLILGIAGIFLALQFPEVFMFLEMF